jgi:antirestriction protein
MSDTPRIYVACLAAYNNGKLHGTWIDAAQDEEAIWEAIHAMLKASPEPGAEEWAIHDYEGFYDIKLGENPNIKDVSAIGQFLSDNEDKAEQIIEVAQHLSNKLDEAGLESAKDYIAENYKGEFKDVGEYASQLAEETGANLGDFERFIDWDSVGAEYETGGDIFTIDAGNGKVHVYTNQ